MRFIVHGFRNIFLKFFILNNNHPIILFDGVCNYCNSMVNFVLAQDAKEVFRFAPLQSGAAQQILKRHNLPTADFGSFVFIENDQTYLHSTAALKVLKRLPWYWQWTQVFWIVPKRLRDGVYFFIAKNRYKWFGKRDTCMVPHANVRNRFL